MDMMDIVKTGLGSLTGGSGNQAALLQAVTSLIGGQQGGLGGLVKAFEQQGLGTVVSSWISTGANLPISPDQITKGLGADAVNQFATHAGIAPESAGSTLASMLPQLVDKLTPNGKLPDSPQLPGLDALKGLIGL